jgi:hypothetical protein
MVSMIEYPNFALKVLQAGFMYACEIQGNVRARNEEAREVAAAQAKIEAAKPLTFRLRDPNEPRK